jgi:cytochrome c-type biogenesis protein CcmH/NrfG
MKDFCIPSSRVGLAMLFLAIVPPGRATGSATASGQKERAASALEEDIKADPTNAELWLHLGFAQRKLGQINDAQKAFEKVTSLNPQLQDAYYMLGLIYESKHMTPEAKKAWEQYLTAETNPDRRAIAEKHIHHLSQ